MATNKDIFFSVASSFSYMGAHIIYFQDLSKCNSRHTTYTTLSSILLFIASVSQIPEKLQICTFVTQYIRAAVPGLIFYFLTRALFSMDSKSIACDHPRFLVVIDNCILYAFGAMIGALICVLIIMLTIWVKDKKQRERARKELEKIYETIKDKSFNLDKFISKYKDVIDKFGMDDRDLKVLKQFAYVYEDSHLGDLKDNEKESKQNADKDEKLSVLDEKIDEVEKKEEKEVVNDDCSVCLGDYLQGDLVIKHPGCIHRFHWECLEPWLKRKDYKCGCPMCKTPTMTNMLKDLKTKYTKSSEDPIETELESLSSSKQTESLNSSILHFQQPPLREV